jgi:hypothetical protein
VKLTLCTVRPALGWAGAALAVVDAATVMPLAVKTPMARARAALDGVRMRSSDVA